MSYTILQICSFMPIHTHTHHARTHTHKLPRATGKQLFVLISPLNFSLLMLHLVLKGHWKAHESEWRVEPQLRADMTYKKHTAPRSITFNDSCYMDSVLYSVLYSGRCNFVTESRQTKLLLKPALFIYLT